MKKKKKQFKKFKWMLLKWQAATEWAWGNSSLPALYFALYIFNFLLKSPMFLPQSSRLCVSRSKCKGVYLACPNWTTVETCSCLNHFSSGVLSWQHVQSALQEKKRQQTWDDRAAHIRFKTRRLAYEATKWLSCIQSIIVQRCMPSLWQPSPPSVWPPSFPLQQSLTLYL